VAEADTSSLTWIHALFRILCNSAISAIVNIIMQGCAKTRVFHQKPNPVGLTGLNRVLMGFLGKTGENSKSLCEITIYEPNLKNLHLILHKIDDLYHHIFANGYKFRHFFPKLWLQLKNFGEKLIKPSFPHMTGFFLVVITGLNRVG